MRSLGRTIIRWRTQIAAWHQARFTNAPTEAANNLIKRVKRIAFGFTRFRNYRVRVLLYPGRLSRWAPGRTCPGWPDSSKPTLWRAAQRIATTTARPIPSTAPTSPGRTATATRSGWATSRTALPTLVTHDFSSFFPFGGCGSTLSVGKTCGLQAGGKNHVTVHR